MAAALERSLRLACTQKKHEKVVKLLDDGADPNSELAKDTNSGATPLHFACWHGWLDVVTTLCEKHDFDANIPDFEQRTPLHYACRNGHLGIVMLLLQQGCKADIMDKKKRTPLQHACEKNHVEIVCYFIDQFGITSDCNKTEILTMACRKGCLDIVKRIDVPRNCAETLILSACQNDHMDIASYLVLEKGMTISESVVDKLALSACTSGYLDLLIKVCSQVNCERVYSVRDPNDQRSLLHCACQNGHTEIVQYLTEQKCDPQCVDKNDRTPLHLASLNGQLHIVQLLITKLNCRPDVKDDHQRTPLHYACENGKLDIVRYLVDEQGCDPNQMDDNQQTPAASSCQQEYLEIIQYFFNKNLIFSDQDKVDILKLACKHGQVDLFDSVIKQIDIDDDTCHQILLTDEYQQALLCIACQHGHKDMVDYLMNTLRLCQPQFKERSELIPLKAALQQGHMDILQYFVDTCSIHSITMLVCKYGELDILQAIFSLIAEGLDNSPIRYEGQLTPLHLASHYGHISIVKHFILDQNNDPDVRDENGQTPLHYASLNGHLDVVMFFYSTYDPKANQHVQTVANVFYDHHQNTPLHCACKGGHINVAKYLIIEQSCSPYHQNADHYTPLHFSCRGGHIEVIEYLVNEQGCDLDVTDKYGATPLHHASQLGHLHVVDYLINKQNCNPEVRNDKDGSTPLHHACQCGHLHVVEFLINNHACNPEAKDYKLRTPLHLACEYGKLDIVKYLAEQGCGVCVTDCDQRTPLYYAFKNDHMHIVSFFINIICDGNYDKAHAIMEIFKNACEFGRIDLVKTCNFIRQKPFDSDENERTPLHIACQYGHLNIVKYLMKKPGSNPAAEDRHGQTPLHYALQNSHMDIVYYFLSKCDMSAAIKTQGVSDPLKAVAAHVSNNSCINEGKRDLLLLAIKVGHLGFVKFMFEVYHCSLEGNDKNLLHLACKYGYIDIDIIKYLQLGSHDQETRDDHNRTPLHFACEGGYLEIVQYLIREHSCNMNAKDSNQLMPLHYAIKNGYLDIVQYLIEEGCDSGKDNGDSIALLHYAAMFGQESITSYLIMECSFNPEVGDKDKKPPLHYAALYGHRTMVQYLIVEQKCCPDVKDKNLWTPLHFACKGGYLVIIKYLVKEQGCDSQCLAKDQEVPLHIASQFGHVDVMNYLIHTENSNPNIRNVNGMTPLHFGACGNMQSVQYLVDELGCNPNVTDAEEQTPLHHACKNGCHRIANYLIREKGCNPEVKDKYGSTPLLYALQNNHLETVKYLTNLLSVGHYCEGVDMNLELLFYFCKHGYITLLDSITSIISGWVNSREKHDQTPLHYACKYGHIDIVKYIALYSDQECEIEATDMYQLTPLNYACLYRHRDIVEYLSSSMSNADPFLTHFINYTPAESNIFRDFLFLACKVGHLGFVKLIVEDHKWNPDIYDEDQITPLHYACEKGHMDIVQFLFSKQPHLQYDDKEDILFFACKQGQFELVVSIVEGHKFNPEVRDQDQRTPFYYACSNQHISIAQYLAAQSMHSTYYRQEALVTACQAGLLNIMKSIINGISKWDPETKDINGHSLLHHACIYGRLNVILYLVGEFHCDLMSKDDYQFTPLDYALQHSHKHIAEHFLGDTVTVHVYQDTIKVADIINRSGSKWLTPLHVACQAGCLAAVQYFINEKGYSSEVRDKNDCTPLHYAAQNCHAEVVRYLVYENNCDPDAIDINHFTPLHFICSNSNANIKQGADVVRILLNKMTHTKRDGISVGGNTPLHLACLYNNYVATDILLSKGNGDPIIKNDVGQTPLELALSFEIFGAFIQSQRKSTKIAYHELISVRKEEDALQIMQKLTDQNKWDPNTRTNKGENVLHFACRACKQKIILYLLRETNCDPNVKNATGITPFLISPKWIISLPSYIRLFAYHGASDAYTHAIVHLDEVEALGFAKYLTTQGTQDLNEKDSRGESVLHSACRANRPRIVQYLLSDGNCNPNIKHDVTGLTPVYYILNPDIIGHLIKHGADLFDVYLHITSQKEDVTMNIIEHLSYYTTSWNPNKKTKSGEIALHFAIKAKQVKIVSYLLPIAMSDVSVQEDILVNGCRYLSEHLPDWNPNLTVSNGYNTLHLACMANKCTVVHCLLSEMSCDPNKVSEAGDVPLQLTSNPEILIQLIRHGANLPNVYQTHGKILGTKEPLKPPVKVFVVGNPSVGKSTLTAALQKELPLLARTFANKRVFGVDEKTAGVVPHEFESRKFGRVTLYDFAGQREFYSSHTALLQNAVQHSSPIFLIVISLTDTDEVVMQNITYWVSFIGNQCTSVTSKPHIIIVGSHADILKAEGQDPKEKGYTIDSFCAVSLGFNLEYVGFIAMDCQYFESAGMSDLRHYLKKSCDALRIPETISFNAHCFQVYLLHKFQDSAAIQIKHVLATVADSEQGTNSDISSFIPSAIHSLLNICKELNERGHILFLENSNDVTDSWIVLDKAALLSDVTGTIFAPEGFRQHCQLASSTGVVPLQKLRENFPNHNADMLVGFLSQLEFCHEIIDHEVLKLIEKHQAESSETCSPDEQYFFFPGLVRLERLEGIWKKSKLYVCGWIMQCSQPEGFFTSRFLQVLFLRLAFTFAMVQSREAIDHQIPAIQRRCSVWKSGIYWGTGQGVEALVEVLPNSKAIIFLIQSGNLSESIKLRSCVLRKIRDSIDELYMNVKISEGFIDPSIISECPAHVRSNYILHTREIAEAIIFNESDTAVSQNGTPLSLQNFLIFEPYMELGEPLLQLICDEHNPQLLKRITNEFIRALSNQIKKADKICMFLKIFNNNPIQTSDISQAIHSWRNKSEGTYKCLKDRLDMFSIFTGRNIFVSYIYLPY